MTAAPTTRERRIPSRDQLGLTRSRSKDGTGLFEWYITVQYVDEELRLVLGCLPVPAGEPVPEMVRDLLGLVREAGAMVKLILLNREFFSTEVIQELTWMNADCLMPCIDTPVVVTATKELVVRARSAVSTHTITKSHSERVPYTMIIVAR